MKKRLVLLAIAIMASPLIRASSLSDAETAGAAPQTGVQPALIESAFSPDRGAEALVLKVIDASTTRIRLAAYSFTSPTVIQALLRAKKRGVDVRVIADDKRNKGKTSVAALTLVANAGIPTRTVSVYAMHHDKYIVSDDKTVQNGSFNYTKDAAESNSENVVVQWNNPQLAQAFLQHWDDRWSKGVDFKASH